MNENEPKWDKAFAEELAVVCGDDVATKKDKLVGLAFSGGGIRSATFNLGVLEALKDLGLLEKIDYLSTVSGGGYIGAWLSANCRRNPGFRGKKTNWSDSIEYLRSYSNYLAPLLGFFSADTWAVGMVWLRNTALVQITVILAIAAALTLPRLVFPLFAWWHAAGNWRWITVLLFVFGVVGVAGNQLRVNRKGDSWVLESKNWLRGLAFAAVCLGIAGGIIFATGFDPFHGGVVDYRLAAPIAFLLVLGGFFLMPLAATILNEREINYTQGWVQAVVVIPMMISGLLVAGVIWGEVLPGQSLGGIDTFGGMVSNAWRYWPFPLTVVFCSVALLAYCSVRTAKTFLGMFAIVLAPVASVATLHLLLSALALLLQSWAQKGPEGEWHAFSWAPAAVVYAFGLTIIVLIGIVGRQSTEGAREWWSRLGAWLGIYGTAWMIVSAASIYGPFFVAVALTWKWSAIGGWVGSTIAGLMAGNSSSTGGPDTQKKSVATQLKEVIATVAPFVFIAGLLIAVASLIHYILRLESDIGDDVLYWYQLQQIDQHAPINWIVMGACLLLLGLFASRVDINEFSLNAFYRSRLVRCYLGATRPATQRHPQNFTNFDDADDICLAKLVAANESGPTLAGPFHIVNCALNLGGSSDLTVHTRHSANYTLTPLHCGSRYPARAKANSDPEELGYVKTKVYGGEDNQPTLGQAISISGAAASPNMGYHTSTVVAFLLTLFNVRLGWWLPKPDPKDAKDPSPWFSLHYLVTELFGLADARANFLAISDGGHFENLAAYELIKRRCKVIIIGDAECDPDLKFEGLGTLIRMCKVDFNATIDINVASIAKGTCEWSDGRCAIGRIWYNGDVEPSGHLIYLKASMTGHEDTAILQYKSAHATFPHESTGNQFYAEDQFESYRLLGKDIATATFKPAINETEMPALAAKLFNVWSPTLRQVSKFTENSERLMDLWANIGKTPGLNFLDYQLAKPWPDAPTPEFRSGFYIASQMLQLMENVYLDLNLEETWDHPDNRGWKEMFQIWAKAGAVRDTWSMTCKTYGTRFRYFCERNLGLPV